MALVSLAELVDAVRSGDRLASFPTDTVPALAAKPDAAGLIYAAKQRTLDKPLILMAGDEADLWAYLQGSPAEQAQWQALMRDYWPGALTLVLPATDRVSRQMNSAQPGTIGVRVPNHDLARHILRQTGPLATTSVNRSGEPALLDMGTIAQAFPQVLQLMDAAIAAIAGANPIGSTQPSTVIRWTGAGWEILRQGAVILPNLIQQP
jgi:L-threonylcarbamoyladenylate synthase